MGLIVYPPQEHQTDSSTIFFIGSAEKYCKINGLDVELVSAGNFCPVFELEPGENIFKVQIDDELLEYKIVSSNSLPKPQSLFANPQSLTKQLVSKPTVCIDPGHGGTARGTCSPKGIVEKDLNLSLALKLQELNPDFVLTRDSDIDLALADRVRICQENNCDLFISLHHNAIPDHLNPIEHEGVSVHYYYDHSKAFAQELLDYLVSQTGQKSAGIIQQDLHVLRENPETIAVLVEFGYLIHPQESELISSDDYQFNLAQYINRFISGNL